MISGSLLGQRGLMPCCLVAAAATTEKNAAAGTSNHHSCCAKHPSPNSDETKSNPKSQKDSPVPMGCNCSLPCCSKVAVASGNQIVEIAATPAQTLAGSSEELPSSDAMRGIFRPPR
jgi:hypothetical protein